MTVINKYFLAKYELEELKKIIHKIKTYIVGFWPIGPGEEGKKWCVDKIYDAYNSRLDDIIEEFERENKEILPKIKLYFLGIDDVIGNNKKMEVEVTLKEWGLYFDSIGCESNMKRVFVDRYRKEIVAFNIDDYKTNSRYPKYLSLLLFIFELSKVIDSKKKFKEYENGKDEIINYVKEKEILQINHPVKNIITYSLKNMDIKKVFSNDEELFNLIRDFYKYIFSIEKYPKYLIDIERIKHIQQSRVEWIKFNKVKIISNEKLKILEEFNLIKIYITNNEIFVQLTDMGLSLLEDKLVEKWNGEVLYLLDGTKEIISINDNPIKITKGLINKTLIQEDTLIIFEKQIEH